MTDVLAPLPTAEQLADLLLTPGRSEAALTAELTAQAGARPARRLLAAAHSIAAERLWAAA
ncbi:hypothetical protein ACFUJX_19725 [Streptomyces rubiginosohelvolus]|uniref:hypothetical protein n=1 Tax=Streptomyces TaxID=1883 RepID=UPI000BF1000E|nr:hypothetical protein [Streptomyces sp. rh34]